MFLSTNGGIPSGSPDLLTFSSSKIWCMVWCLKTIYLYNSFMQTQINGWYMTEGSQFVNLETYTFYHMWIGTQKLLLFDRTLKIQTKEYI